jgi:hypothetical protein
MVCERCALGRTPIGYSGTGRGIGKSPNSGALRGEVRGPGQRPASVPLHLQAAPATLLVRILGILLAQRGLLVLRRPPRGKNTTPLEGRYSDHMFLP